MNPFSSAVNQKMFLTRLLLEQVNPDEDKFGHVELALSQSALFQLFCAYNLYLSEIASNYKVPVEQSITDVQSLCDALLAADKYPSEAAEIRNLFDDPHSWLSGLFNAYSNVSRPQSLAHEDKQQLIVVAKIDDTNATPEVNGQLISRYRDCFNEMLERHRELMIEC